MAKIYIQIELDSTDEKTPSLLQALSLAFIDDTKVATAEAEAPEVPETPKVEEKEKVQKASTKKTKKASKVVTDEVEELPTKDLDIEEAEVDTDVSFTVDDVRTIMAEAKRSGKDAASLRAILKANGAAVVSDLDPKKYAAVIKAVKAL